MSLPDLPPSASLSKDVLSPCPKSRQGSPEGAATEERGGIVTSQGAPSEPTAPPLPSAPANLPVTGLKRQIRELAQEICGLIGELADVDRPRRLLHESCWFFDEVGERAERIESQAKALRHMCDVMWERAYQEGVRRRAYHEPQTLDEFDQTACVSGSEQLANGVRF